MKRKLSGFFLNRWTGYLFAVVSVVVATWLKYLAQPDIIPGDLPNLYLLAIVLTAILYGLGPSLFCSFLAVLTHAYFFLPPIHSLSFNISVFPISLVFAVVSVIISYFSSLLRKKSEEAKREIALRKGREAELISYRENLETLIKQRTGELEKANLDLKNEISEHKKDEESLKESQNLLQAFFESPGPMRGVVEMIDDDNIRFLVVNAAAASFFRLPADYQNRIDSEIGISPQYTHEWVDHYKQAMASGQPSNFQLQRKVGDNQFFLQAVVYYIPGTSGKPRFAFIIVDVTEQKKAGEALKEYQNLLRAFFESPGVQRGVVEIIDDHTTRYIMVNEETANFAGLKAEDLRNKTSTELNYSPEIIRLWMDHYRKSLESRQPVTFEYEHPYSGKKIWFSVTVTYLQTDSINPRFTYVVHDITNRKHAEDNLQETRDYLDNLINYANAPIIVWNPDLKITRFNHAFERVSGLAAEEVLGKKIDILFPETSRDESMKHILEATSGERWETLEIPIKHKDGTIRILLWNSASLYDKEGETIIATIAQGQDITERKKAERVKDDFISLISHELRTPMMVINGSLRTAQSEGISPEDKEILIQNAIEGAGTLSAILENLLELSRYQSGRLQLHTEKISVPDITKNTIEGFRTLAEDHEFLTDFPDKFPMIEADAMRVERIIYNLLDNAVKYSPEDTVIKVSGREKDGQVIISVADQGAGIKQEDQEKIFEPYETLENVINTKGLGLGLVLCRRLVEAMGGQIWVESKPGKGSTFFFTLPVKKRAD